MTIAILIVKGLGTSFEKKILVFNVVLLLCQVEYLLLRLSISIEVINQVDLYLSFFWIALGAFLLDAVYETKLVVIKYFFWIRFLFFIISLFLFISYITFPIPRIFLESETFGLVLGFREGSLDKLIRIWIGLGITVSICIVGYALLVDETNFKKLKLFFIGLLIPLAYELVFQIYFPFSHGFEIPGATILLSGFSFFSLIIFRENFMFLNFKNENFNSIFDKINSIVFIFDDKGSISYGNRIFKNYYPDTNSIFNFKEGSKFLDTVSKFLKSNSSWNNSVKDNEVLISEEKIRNDNFQFMCYPIHDNTVTKGGIVFGLNVSKFFQMKNSLMNSFENFKRLNGVPNSYFLEIDILKKQVIFNDRFLERFLIFTKKQYTYLELVLFLKNAVDRDSMILVFNILRNDLTSVFEDISKKIILQLNNESVYYVFEISFKKIDHHVIANNHLIYLSDVTGDFVNSLKNDWIKKSTPWIVSHVFRKPVANIRGLMNLVNNEKGIFDSRLSTFEIFSLIDTEIKELDGKIEVFSERTLEK